MAAAQRKLLEELMGTAAMKGTDEVNNYKEEKICKSFLCGLCPYELFTNTKADLGSCEKVHVEKLKKDYERDLENGGIDFSLEFLLNLKTFVDDCEKKIRFNKNKLEKSFEEKKINTLVSEIADLTNEISSVYFIGESLIEEKKWSDAGSILEKADEFMRFKLSKEKELVKLSQNFLKGDEVNTLRVCEICSSFLSIYDSDKRLSDHFSGKMHVGFLLIRDKIKELEEKLVIRIKTEDCVKSYRRESLDSRSYEERRERERDRDRRRDDYKRESRRRSRSPYSRRRY
ncbi:splicing factor [Lobulomyces angularis]|nr:splicing factor [Lobulomyces angularis]